jgi:hypothetical protein
VASKRRGTLVNGSLGGGLGQRQEDEGCGVVRVDQNPKAQVNSQIRSEEHRAVGEDPAVQGTF